MAKVRTRGDLTCYTLKRRRIEPKLARWIIQVGISDDVRTDRAVRQADICRTLNNREGEPGSDGEDAVHLPSPDERSDHPLQIAAGKVPHEVGDGPMSLV